MAETFKSERAFWTNFLWSGALSKIKTILHNLSDPPPSFVEAGDIEIPILTGNANVLEELLKEPFFGKEIDHEFDFEWENTYTFLNPKHHDTLLMRACAESDYESVRLLLDHGADVHHVSRNGETALVRACSAFHEPTPKIVQALLAYRPLQTTEALYTAIDVFHEDRLDELRRNVEFPDRIAIDSFSKTVDLLFVLRCSSWRFIELNDKSFRSRVLRSAVNRHQKRWDESTATIHCIFEEHHVPQELSFFVCEFLVCSFRLLNFPSS